MATVACKRSRRRPVASSQPVTVDENREQQKSMASSSRSRSCLDSHIISPRGEVGRFCSDRVSEVARRHQKQNTGKRMSCRNMSIRTSCSTTETAIQSANPSSSLTCMKQKLSSSRCRSATPDICLSSNNHLASPSCSYTSVLSSMTSDFPDNDSASSFKSLVECPISDSWRESENVNEFRICPRTQIRRVVDAADSWGARQMCDNEWNLDPYSTSQSDNELYASTVHKCRRFKIHQPQKFRKTSGYGFDPLPSFGLCLSQKHMDTLDCDADSNSGLSTDVSSFAPAERYWYDDDADTRRHCRQRLLDRSFDADDCLLTDDDVHWTLSEGSICSPIGRPYDSLFTLKSWKRSDAGNPLFQHDVCDSGRFDTSHNFFSIFGGTYRSYPCADESSYRTSEMESCEKRNVEEASNGTMNFNSTGEDVTKFGQKQSRPRSELPAEAISGSALKGSSAEKEKADRANTYDDSSVYVNNDQNSTEETSIGESESASIYDDPNNHRPESGCRRQGRTRAKTTDQAMDTGESSSTCHDSDSRYVCPNYSYRKGTQAKERRTTGWSSCRSIDGLSSKESCLPSSYCADAVSQNSMGSTTCRMQDDFQTNSCSQLMNYKASSNEPVDSRAQSPSACMWAAERERDFASTCTLNGLDDADCNALAKEMALSTDCQETERDMTTINAELDCTGIELSTLAEFDCTEPADEKTTFEAYDCTEPAKEMTTCEAEPETGAEPVKDMTSEPECEQALSEPNGEELEQGKTVSCGYADPELMVTFRAYIPTTSDMYSSDVAQSAYPECNFIAQSTVISMRNSQQMVTSFVVPLYTDTTLPPAKCVNSLPSKFKCDDIMVSTHSHCELRRHISSEDLAPLVPSTSTLKECDVVDSSQEGTGFVNPRPLEGADETILQQPAQLSYQSPRAQQHVHTFSDQNAPQIHPIEPPEEQLHCQNAQIQARLGRTKSAVTGHQTTGLKVLAVIPENESWCHRNESDTKELANSSNRRAADSPYPSLNPLPVPRNQRRPETQMVFNETLPVHTAGQTTSSASHSQRVRCEEMADVAQLDAAGRIDPCRTSAANRDVLHERQLTGIKPQQTRIPRPQAHDPNLKSTSPVDASPASLPPTPTLLLQIQILPRNRQYIANEPAAQHVSDGSVVLPQMSKIPVPVTTIGTQTSLTLLQLQPDSIKPGKGTEDNVTHTSAPKVSRHPKKPKKVLHQSDSSENATETGKDLAHNGIGTKRPDNSHIKDAGPESMSEMEKGIATNGAKDQKSPKRVSSIDLVKKAEHDFKSLQMSKRELDPTGKNESIQTSLVQVKPNTTQTTASLLQQQQQPRSTKKNEEDAQRDPQPSNSATLVSDLQDDDFPEAALDCQVCLKRMGLPTGSSDLQQFDAATKANPDCEVCRKRLSLPRSSNKDKKNVTEGLQQSVSPISAKEDIDLPKTESPGAAKVSEAGQARSGLTKSTKEDKRDIEKGFQQSELKASAKENNDLPKFSEAAEAAKVGPKSLIVPVSTKKDTEQANRDLQQSDLPMEKDNGLQLTEFPEASEDVNVDQKRSGLKKDVAATPTARNNNGTTSSKIPVRTRASGPQNSLTQQPVSPAASKGTENGLQPHGALKPSKDTQKALHHAGSPQTSGRTKNQLDEPGPSKETVDDKRLDKSLKKPNTPEGSSDTKTPLQQPDISEGSKHAKPSLKEPGSSKVGVDPKRTPHQSESPKSVKFNVKKDVQKDVSGSDTSKVTQQSSSQKSTEDSNTDRKQKRSVTYYDNSGKKAFSEVALRSAKGSPAKIANSTIGLVSEPKTPKDVVSSKTREKKDSFENDTERKAVSISSDFNSSTLSGLFTKIKGQEKMPKPKDAKRSSKTETKRDPKKARSKQKHGTRVKLKDETKTKKKKLREPAIKNPSIPKELTKTEAEILHNPSALIDAQDAPDKLEETSPPPPQWDAVSTNDGGKRPVSILKKDDGGRRLRNKSTKKSTRLVFNEEVEIMFIDDDEYMDQDEDYEDRRDASGSESDN